jgi:hypothetical protein
VIGNAAGALRLDVIGIKRSASAIEVFSARIVPVRCIAADVVGSKCMWGWNIRPKQDKPEAM